MKKKNPFKSVKKKGRAKKVSDEDLERSKAHVKAMVTNFATPDAEFNFWKDAISNMVKVKCIKMHPEDEQKRVNLEGYFWKVAQDFVFTRNLPNESDEKIVARNEMEAMLKDKDMFGADTGFAMSVMSAYKRIRDNSMQFAKLYAKTVQGGVMEVPLESDYEKNATELTEEEYKKYENG